MRGEYTERLIARASSDEDFRRMLLDDPKAAISDELGVETPDELTIRVIEEDAGEVILALPPTATPEALRDEELASAAGGDVWGAQTVETCQLSPCGVQKTNPGCCEGR
jgi:hypothetical protein